jgi:large subunit ribosomal protein L4
MALTTYTSSGNKAQTPYKLPKSMFAVEIKNHQLLKDAYLAYMANNRGHYAKTLKRGEVRGGGAKPWRQKGTGRARVGSSRNPIWTGGGVVFGPSGNENYSRKLNVKAKQKALAQALTLCVDKNLIVVDDFSIKDGKTKSANTLINKLSAKGKVLIGIENFDDLTSKAVNNLPNVKLQKASSINVFDILNSDSIVLTKKAIEALEKRVGGLND